MPPSSASTGVPSVTSGAMSPAPVTVKTPAGLAVSGLVPRHVRGDAADGDGSAGPGTAVLAAAQADTVERGGGVGGRRGPGCAGDLLVRLLEVSGGRDEHPGLHDRGESGQGDGADPGPVDAVGGVVAGDDVAGPGQAQPARRRRRRRARQPGSVAGVVPLHPRAVAAGDHDGRVGRSLPGTRGDDQPGLRPRHHGGLGGYRLPLRGCPVAFGYLGQRGDPGRDAAVAAQRAVHEVEGVGHCLAARADRERGVAAGDARAGGARRGVIPVPDEQGEQEGQQHRGGHGDAPAADRAELGPLGVEQVREPGSSPGRLRPGGRDRGHDAARNSTAPLVSSM